MMGAIGDACQRIKEQASMSGLAARAGLHKLQRSGNEWKACCPFHEDRTPSFTIYADDRRWFCHGACGEGGDQIDFIRKYEKIDDISEAIRRIDTEALAPAPPRAGDRTREEKAQEARAIWRDTSPITGTAGEVYLRGRGITIAIPDTVRFGRLPYGRGQAHPCVVAAVAVDRKLTGVQRTYLANGGTSKLTVDKPKLSLGRVRGSAIRLAPSAAEIVVCEGLEDGLTLQQELRLPVWVAAGASMLRAMRLPDVCTSVIIAADRDEAGEAQAQEAAAAFARTGRAVRIIRPDPAHKDFNDMLLGRQS